jgi:hypothetical protein
MLPNWHPLALLFGYLPLLLTLGLASFVAKGIIWLTALLIGPFVALLWRTRRRLADATAVQLTRQPDALAGALRALAALDVTVPGAVAVHFLFPVWDPAVDLDQTRTDVASALLRMQLPLEPRLQRLQRLGATAEPGQTGSTAEGVKSRLWEVAEILTWLGLAGLFLGGLVVVSALAAALVLYLLGWLLHLLLVTTPRWVARLWA